MDIIDKKLLYQLDIDARQSLNQLGKKLGKSPEVVRYRLNRLIEHKIVLGFNTVIDIGRLGFYHYETYLRFQKLTDEKEKEIIDYLKKANHVLWLASCSGHYDIVLSVMAKDNIEFSDVISKILDNFGEYIVERNMQSTIRIPHFTRRYLVEGIEPKEFEFASSNKDKTDIDRIDFKILRKIMDNGRIPITEAASEIGLSADIVKYRISQLKKKGIIQTFRAHIDKYKIDRLHYQILFNFKNLNTLLKNRFIEFCRGIDCAVYVLDTIGKYDLIFELEPHDQKEFESILRRIRNEFSEHLVDYEPLSITNDYKYDYFRIDEKEFFG